MHVPKVILTRPQPESRSWIEPLCASGFNAVNWPLIDIVAHTEQDKLKELQASLPKFKAVMFVSSSAVEHFTDHNDLKRKLISSDVACWATGPGTAQTLMRLGINSARITTPSPIAKQFDSKQLWLEIKDSVRPKDQVLFVKGLDQEAELQSDLGVSSSKPLHASQRIPGTTPSGSNWLIHQLQDCGLTVQCVHVYARTTPVWSDAQKALAKDALNRQSIWVFSSSIAIEHLAQLLPDQDWSNARAIATHDRIAEKAKQVGWGVVLTSRPTPNDVLTLLKSIEPY
jgi:uroporphyrinogen-III synthase